MKTPYLRRAYLRREGPLDVTTYPGAIPFVPNLALNFEHNITFFVGENGFGKSSLLEALVALSGLTVAGGGKNGLLGSAHQPAD